MQFLVFMPNCELQDREEYARPAGLSHLLNGHHAVTMAGPHGLPGVLINWPSPDSPYTHFDADKQTWLPSIRKNQDGEPWYYVGIWNENPPKESELRRKYTQPGNRVRFGAETWKLPTPDTVDARAVYSDDGSMRWEVIREFSWMCDEAKALCETYLEEGGVRAMVFQVDPSAQIDWLLKLLQVNYRLLPEVAAYLDMWIGKDHLLDTFMSTLGLVRKGGGEDA